MHKRGGSSLNFYLVQWLFSQEIILFPFYFLPSRITKYRHSAISNGPAPPPAFTACVHISQFKLTRRTVRVGEWETKSESEKGGAEGLQATPSALQFLSVRLFILNFVPPPAMLFSLNATKCILFIFCIFSLCFCELLQPECVLNWNFVKLLKKQKPKTGCNISDASVGHLWDPKIYTDRA